MSAIKKSIIVKVAFLCLARALFAMSKVNGDPNYVSCTDGYGFKNLFWISEEHPVLI